MASITHGRSETQEVAGHPSLALAARLLLASLALAAGAVHLAMAPIHAPESAAEATGFAVAGWLQIVLGIALLLRPSRDVLFAAVVVNVGIIAGYLISRSVGLPVGANPGDPESVEAVDLMTTIFEGALVVGAAILLVRPDFGELRGGVSFEALAPALAMPVLVLAGASVLLADPDLTQHGHGNEEAGGLVSADGVHGHGEGGAGSAQLAALAENRCDLDINPAAYWRETTMAGIDTLTGGQNPGRTSLPNGSAELDRLTALHTTVEGEVGDAQMVLALAKVPDDVYEDWLRWMGYSGQVDHAHEASLAPDDTTMGGHLGPQAWHAMTDREECEKLKGELQLARETALKYPTVADAKAAGWRQVTPYVPGIAAHFMNFRIVDDKFEIEQPEMLLYDGTADDARVVGLSYYIRHEGDAEPTQGFTGPNDHFHRHIGLCVDESGVIGDSTTTEEECAARGGRKAQGGNGWMNHVWIVPGCESPWGMFSGASPILDAKLAEDAGASGAGCAGSGVRGRYNLEEGSVENVPTAAGGEMELATGQ